MIGNPSKHKIVYDLGKTGGEETRMGVKKNLLMIAAAAVLNVPAAEKVLLEQNFEQNPGIAEWTSPGEHKYSIQKEDGKSFLQVRGFFPVRRKLQGSAKIDDTVRRIEIETTVRKAPAATLISFSLSSCTVDPVFRNGRDSGFSVHGYHYNNQDANRILWRRDGEDFVMKSPVSPFNFLEAADANSWVIWKLVYDHEEHQLRFTKNGKDKPSLIQRNADLSGCVMEAFYLGQGDYRTVKVVLTTK